MIFLTDTEKAQIRQLMFQPQWQTVVKVADDIIKEIQDNSPIRDTTDETLKEVYMQEGKVRGIRDLLQKLLDISNQ